MIKKLFISTFVFAAIITALFVATSHVVALDPGGEITNGVNAAGGGAQVPLETRIKDIVNVLLFILGAVAVIMIIIGGIRYTTSGGDSSAVTSAKNTILYAVVGLIVAMLAYAIVNFVVGKF